MTPEPPPREALLLGGILAVALLLPALTDRLPAPADAAGRLFLPGLWLLGTCRLWARRHPAPVLRLSGGRHARSLAGAAALVLAGGLLLFAGLEPPRAAPAALPLQLAALFLLVPLAEECYFRGVLLEHLAGQLGRPAALLLATLLFAGLHWTQGLFLPMAGLGLAAGLAAQAARSLCWAVWLHAAWNGLALASQLPAAPWREWVAGGLALALAAALLAGALSGDRERSGG